MQNSKVTNGVALIVLITSSLLYIWLVAEHLPSKLSIGINIGLIPFLFGCAGFYALRAKLLTKIVLLILLPISHVLVFGGDTAKPGIENVIAAAELVFIWLGLFTCYLACRKKTQ